jgi:hypothetical protein
LTERRDIGSRLENWGRWARERAQAGISPTGVYCERLKKAALGDLGRGSDERRKVDEVDAKVMEDAILTLADWQVLLLKLCYVEGSPPEYVARKCRFKVRDFTPIFRSTQRAAECAAEIC